MKKILLLLAALALTTTTALYAQRFGWWMVERTIGADFPDAPQLSTDSLAAWIARGERPLLLDVRTEAEYSVSHLPGARRIDPGAPDLNALAPLSRDTPIVAYCSVGYRSSALVERLRAMGFTEVVNLKGSIFRWANEGRPLVRDGAPVQVVHPYNALWGRLLDREHRAAVSPVHSRN